MHIIGSEENAALCKQQKTHLTGTIHNGTNTEHLSVNCRNENHSKANEKTEWTTETETRKIDSEFSLHSNIAFVKTG